MAESSLDMAAAEIPIDVEWRAFELRPAGTPPMDPSYKARIESTWPQVIEMGRQYGVEMRTHRFGINTRAAHRALKIVQRLAPAQAKAFNDALFRAYFYDDQDIGDPEVLAALADALGIDGPALGEALAASEALAEVHAEERAGYQLGISGVPAFIFEDKYLVTGVLPPAQLVAAVEEVRRREGLP